MWDAPCLVSLLQPHLPPPNIYTVRTYHPHPQCIHVSTVPWHQSTRGSVGTLWMIISHCTIMPYIEASFIANQQVAPSYLEPMTSCSSSTCIISPIPRATHSAVALGDITHIRTTCTHYAYTYHVHSSRINVYLIHVWHTSYVVTSLNILVSFHVAARTWTADPVHRLWLYVLETLSIRNLAVLYVVTWVAH